MWDSVVFVADRYPFEHVSMIMMNIRSYFVRTSALANDYGSM